MKTPLANIPSRTLIALLIASIAFFARPLVGQAGASFPPVPGMDAETYGLMREMVGVYRDAATYRDEGRVTILQERGRIRNITKMPSRIEFRRPRHLQVTSGIETISCNGKDLLVVLDEMRQFKRLEAPERLTMNAVKIGAPGAELDQGLPEVLELLLGDDVLNRWLAQITEILLVRRAEPFVVGDRPCHKIVYRTRHNAVVSLYLDLERSVLIRCDMDYTEAQRPAGMPAPDGDSAMPALQFVYQLDPVAIDEPLTDGLFALRDVTGLREVDAFGQDEADFPIYSGAPGHGNIDESTKPPVELARLIPEFAARDLAGTPIDEQILKGKVGLLFFWAPIGSAESLISLPMMERIRSAFDDRNDVCILGVTSAVEDTGLVRDLLAAKKTHLRTLIDTDGTLARSLQVSVVPTFYLVSRHGKIEEVLTGSDINLEGRLEEALRRLLEG